ncbi:MAG: Dolichyl-phosphate-mannose-protein mannosyltransferase, partial [Acidobacteria bacterium]|nr:Dolichyl-phosphate-mannose-protein mannosyltransferase [Acidobacteriota bacterium]
MERTAGKPAQDGTGESSPKASRIARWRPSLSRWVPIMAVACFLAWSFVAIRPDFSWDDSEPEILNLAWRLANGETIYRGIEEPPFAFAPYPPLYFAATAAMLKFTGLSYLPAKLLSFLAALSIGWALAYLSRQWHGTRKPGLWAACLLFLIPAFLYN